MASASAPQHLVALTLSSLLLLKRLCWRASCSDDLSSMLAPWSWRHWLSTVRRMAVSMALNRPRRRRSGRRSPCHCRHATHPRLIIVGCATVRAASLPPELGPEVMGLPQLAVHAQGNGVAEARRARGHGADLVGGRGPCMHSNHLDWKRDRGRRGVRENGSHVSKLPCHSQN